MNTNLGVKVGMGLVALAVWLIAVYTGHAPWEPLVAACQAVLVGLGVYHVQGVVK